MKLTEIKMNIVNLISDQLVPYINYDFGNQFAYRNDMKMQIQSIYCNKYAAVVICKHTDSISVLKKVGSDRFLEQNTFTKVQIYFTLNTKLDYSSSESLMENLLVKIKYNDIEPVYTTFKPGDLWQARIILHNASIILIHQKKITRIDLNTKKRYSFQTREVISNLIFSKNPELFWVCSSSEASSDFTSVSFYKWDASLSSKNPQVASTIQIKSSHFETKIKDILMSESILFVIESENAKFMIVSSTSILNFDKTNNTLLQVINLANQKLNTFEKINLEVLQLDGILFFRDGSNYWIFEEDIDPSKLSKVFRSLACYDRKSVSYLKKILLIFKGEEWFKENRTEFMRNWSLDLYKPAFSKFNDLSRPSKNVLLYIAAKRLVQVSSPGYYNFVYNAIQKYDNTMIFMLVQMRQWLVDHYELDL